MNYKELTFEQLLDEWYFLSDILENSTNCKGVEKDIELVEKKLSKYKFVRK